MIGGTLPGGASAPGQGILQVAFGGTLADPEIVLAGTAEAVSKVMVPLEAQWTGDVRPHYVLIDSTKVPELITAEAEPQGR